MAVKKKVTVEECRGLNEEGMRDAQLPWPRTQEELLAQIDMLVSRTHDCGTSVYAMSMGALAAFHYVSHKLGVTGFQASCADMDFIARTRHWEYGGRVLDYGDLLYPQYEYKFDEVDFWPLIHANIKPLAKAARKKLAEAGTVNPDVKAHWERIVEIENGEMPSGK